MSIWRAGRSIRDIEAAGPPVNGDIEPGTYTGTTTEYAAGLFTVLLIGDGPAIHIALDDMRVLEGAPSVTHASPNGITRRSKGERKRNKAERWR